MFGLIAFVASPDQITFFFEPPQKISDFNLIQPKSTYTPRAMLPIVERVPSPSSMLIYTSVELVLV